MISKYKILLTVLLFGIIGCNHLKDNYKNIHFTSGSKWTFINTENNPDKCYSEIEFLEDSTVFIYSECDGKIGPIYYKVFNNTFVLNNIKFTIVTRNDESIELKNLKNTFLLYKIPFLEVSSDSNQFDPFYIRRCYFLVNLNYITTDDAIKYLENLSKSEIDSLPEEIILKR